MPFCHFSGMAADTVHKRGSNKGSRQHYGDRNRIFFSIHLKTVKRLYKKKLNKSTLSREDMTTAPRLETVIAAKRIPRR